MSFDVAANTLQELWSAVQVARLLGAADAPSAEPPPIAFGSAA
jgi:hypothetical protein